MSESDRGAEHCLQNQSTESDIRHRMDATVLLIKALRGGWDISRLPGT
jgi:hypothetical protein